MRQHQQSLLRSVVLTAWAMLRLVLLFCVAFLVYGMIQRGEDPLEVSFFRPGVTLIDQNPEAAPRLKTIDLFFASETSIRLVPEARAIEFGDGTVENCLTALEELIDGPREPLGPILPTMTQVRGIYALGDELVIDFSRDLEASLVKSATSEILMIQSVASTLTQAGLRGADGINLRSVRFLFEGATAQDRFPVHVDVSEPVLPQTRWIQARQSERDQ